MLYLNLRLLTDLFTLSFGEGTHQYPIGGFIAETFNRALRDVRLCCPNAGSLDALRLALPWDRPMDLYLPIAQLLVVYRDHLNRTAEALIGP